MSRIMTFTVCSILVASGWIHGRLSDRWGVPGSVVEAAERLNGLPTTIGGWSGTRSDVSPRVLAAAAAENIVDLDFRSPEGDRVHVMIVCGRPGPVTRHPPTVCFTAAGLRQTSPVTMVPSAESPYEIPAAFSKCLFAEEGVPGHYLTRWTFSSTGREWEMPRNPRIAFAGVPWLYKLYVIALETDDERIATARDEFVNQLLLELVAVQ